VALIGPGGGGPGARSVGSPAGDQTVHAGPLTATLPAGWHWLIKYGYHANCTNPIVRLDVTSYRPPWAANPDAERVVVPAHAVLLVITFAPIRSSATPWKRWRLSNRALRPWHPVNALAAELNRYRAYVDLPGSAAVTASATVGSLPMPRTTLAAANGVLRSLRVDQSYACLPGPPPLTFLPSGR